MFRSDDKTRIRNSSRCPRQAHSRLTIRKRQKPNQSGQDKRPRKNRNHRTQASRRRRHVMHFPRKSIFRRLLILRIDNHRRRHKKQRQKSRDQADDDVTHGEVSIEQKSCEEPNQTKPRTPMTNRQLNAAESLLSNGVYLRRKNGSPNISVSTSYPFGTLLGSNLPITPLSSASRVSRKDARQSRAWRDRSVSESCRRGKSPHRIDSRNTKTGIGPIQRLAVRLKVATETTANFLTNLMNFLQNRINVHHRPP